MNPELGPDQVIRKSNDLPPQQINIVGRKILGFATQGAGGNEEDRIRGLLENFSPEIFPFDRNSKVKTFFRLFRKIRREKPDLVVMEGTGSAGGLAVLLGRLVAGVPYVVSSGDAVGPYLTARVAWLSSLFNLYERRLNRHSAGAIGWTPYLVGRALTYGAPRGVTAAGWAPFPPSPGEVIEFRLRIRRQLGIAQDAIVFGIVGFLGWNRRYGYCYGRELVEAINHAETPNVAVLIVGDGNGREKLEALAGSRINRTVFLTGRIPQKDVPKYLAAMDVASLPQSIDQVGCFRYTTKVSEYVASSLPIVTGEIPLAYDLDTGWMWRLPGRYPWEKEYIESLGNLMCRVTADDIARKRDAVPPWIREFDKADQINRVTAFLNDVLRIEYQRRA